VVTCPAITAPLVGAGATVDFPDRKARPMPTTTTNDSPNVPLPAGADEVYEWANLGTTRAYRCFRGRERTIPAEDTGSRPWSEDITVCIQGEQRADGTITRDPQGVQACSRVKD
jgi:hypothetical protein